MEMEGPPRDCCHALPYRPRYCSTASHDACAPHDVRCGYRPFWWTRGNHCPRPAGAALIAVDAAGVGRWDADVRQGFYAGRKPHFPLVLGFDGAGVVAAVGPRVRRLKVGGEVYSYHWQHPKGGFYAEYVVVPADKAAPIPRRLDLRHAGAIPITGLTALQGIDDALGLKKGEAGIIQ